MNIYPLLIVLSIFLFNLSAHAENRVVDFHLRYKEVNFTGCPARAIAINNQIPGPTLHFKEGDDVTINVYNHLNKGSSIHWHGVLVPWQMDGVENVAQKAIPPGSVFHYHFKLYQSGTYWYHAHAGAEEQDGLYGAFLIQPAKPPHYQYTKDYVVVLSDWSNIGGSNIFKKLKKSGNFFSMKLPLQPSLLKFIRDYSQSCPSERKKLLKDYKTMQKTRMGIYDLSDVAYDSYLLNGQTKYCPWVCSVKVGDIVRLRFIGAAGSTIYRVKIPGTQMQVIHVQGNDVKPYTVQDFTIAPSETYDVLVKIKKAMPYIIYAESIDTFGKAYGVLVVDPTDPIPFNQVTPFPEPLPVTREMMANMMKAKHHGSMKMRTEPSIMGDFVCPCQRTETATVGTKYQELCAAVKTNDPDKPVDYTIKMELFGYMDRYIWFINGLPEYKAKSICILPGKRYRIIFSNHSMMRHPMHIHGHWFILRNGHGAYDPLLHSIGVAPGAIAVADVDTDASGQWFFHCHNLYHMMAGMARVFQYQTLVDVAHGNRIPNDYSHFTKYLNRPIVRKDITMPLDCSLIPHPMGHPEGFYFANWLDISEDPFHNVQELTFKGLYGRDYNKLELYINDSELDKGKVDWADLDIFYWHLISQFWAVKGGVNYFYRPGGPYWQPGLGIEGLMPYFIDTDLRTYYYKKSVKFDLDMTRDTQISNKFYVRTEIRSIWATKTLIENEIGSGLNQIRYYFRPYYQLKPGLNLYIELEYDHDYGAYRKIQQNLGESTDQTTVSLGMSFLF